MFGLQETTIYTPCHTYGCHNTATHFLGHADSPNGTVYYVCEQCSNELKQSIVAEAITPVSEAKLEDLNVSALKTIAEDKGITGISKKTKAELIELIEGAE